MSPLIKKILWALVPQKEKIVGYVVAWIAAALAFVAGVKSSDVLEEAMKQKQIVIEKPAEAAPQPAAEVVPENK